MLENAKLYENDFDANGSRSWGATTVINGTAYAAGLFWQPLQNRDDPYAEIEDSAESVLEGADLFTLKPGKTVQFGVCASSDGYNKGLISLAVSVATALSELSSFVAVFKVDNGWWYCCVRNDIILSDGDMLFLKEEDAKEQFMSMMTVPDWGRKIAPAEWGISDTVSGDLATLIADGSRAKLQKIKALRGPKLYAIIIASAVIGFWVLSTLVTDVLFAPKKRPVAIAPVKPKIIKKYEPKPIPKPWDSLIKSDDLLTLCYNDVNNLLKILPPGWKIGGINCDKNGATTSWRREVGRIAWVDKALNQSGITFKARSISNDGNIVIASTGFNLEKIKSEPEYTDTELKNILNDLFQSLDVGLLLNDDKLTVYAPIDPNDRASKNRMAIFKRVQFSFAGVQNPMIWRDVLTKFSGLEITNIKYNTEANIWQYEGVIYVK